jgi:hypothetical protein
MPEKHLYEYAVIRIVPRVEREEFLNIGVVLYCKGPDFLKARCCPDRSRLLLLDPELDLDELGVHLQAFEQISNGDAGAGPIARLDTASRFRWLTATRSTLVQTSKVHPGFCTDPDEELAKLYRKLVVSE